MGWLSEECKERGYLMAQRIVVIDDKGCTAVNILPKSDAVERLIPVVQEALGEA